MCAGLAGCILEFVHFSCQDADSISNGSYSYLIGLLANVDRGRYLKLEVKLGRRRRPCLG